jgi:hypothetical protein
MSETNALPLSVMAHTPTTCSRGPHPAGPRGRRTQARQRRGHRKPLEALPALAWASVGVALTAIGACGGEVTSGVRGDSSAGDTSTTGRAPGHGGEVALASMGGVATGGRRASGGATALPGTWALGGRWIIGGSVAASDPFTGGSPGTGASSGALCSAGACAAVSITSGATACTVGCACNVCGIHRLGTRECPCTVGVYVCSSCDYNPSIAQGNPIVTLPTTPLPACETWDPAMEDRTDCGTLVAYGYRCESLDQAARFCACWNDRWDCAAKPGFWMAIE